MNINCINSANINRNQNINCTDANKEQSFGMVVSTKFLDKEGKVITEPKTMRKAIDTFIATITQRSEQGARLRFKFRQYVDDLDLNFKDNGHIIRDDFDDTKYNQNGIVNFFTGHQADVLAILGKQIGIIRARCYTEVASGTISKERAEETIKAQGRVYFDKMEKYLEDKNLRPKKVVDSLKNESNEMGLCVHVKEQEQEVGNGKRKRKSAKLEVDKDRIIFRQIQKDVSSTPAIKSMPVSVAPSVASAPLNPSPTEKPKSHSSHKPEIIDWPLRPPAKPKASDEFDFGEHE